MNGIFKLNGMITDFKVWDDTINSFVRKFQKKYQVYPNILLSCDYTYRKIDLYVQMHLERVITPDGKDMKTSNLSYMGIDCFEASNYNLRFCVDNELSENSFLLVYDENPEFDGGEPVPVEKNEGIENKYYYRKCA